MSEEARPSRRPASERIPAAARQAAAARDGGTRAAGAGTATGDPAGGARLSRRGRRHRAAGARVAASGLGAGALLGIVGALGAHTVSAGTTKVPAPARATSRTAARVHRAPATTPTTIVWRVVHRVIVVQDPPVQYASSSRAASPRSYTPSYSRTVSGPAPAPSPGPAPAPAVVAAPAPPPAPAPAPPACSGSKCP